MDRIGTDQPTGIFHAALRICRPALLVLLVFPPLLSCSLFEKNKLRDVKSAGELVVLTRTSPTTYYETPEGPAGFEYDLVKSFANYLGVKPRFVVAEKFNDIIPRLLKAGGVGTICGVANVRPGLIRQLYDATGKPEEAGLVEAVDKLCALVTDVPFVPAIRTEGKASWGLPRRSSSATIQRRANGRWIAAHSTARCASSPSWL